MIANENSKKKILEKLGKSIIENNFFEATILIKEIKESYSETELRSLNDEIMFSMSDFLDGMCCVATIDGIGDCDGCCSECCSCIGIIAFCYITSKCIPCCGSVYSTGVDCMCLPFDCCMDKCFPKCVDGCCGSCCDDFMKECC